MNYGIGVFKGNNVGIQIFNNAETIESFALIFLKSRLKEEGLKFNANGIQEYMEGWVESHNEACDEGEEVTEASQLTDSASDTLTYSDVHLQKLVGNTWEPLNSEEKREFCQVICRKLEALLEKV